MAMLEARQTTLDSELPDEVNAIEKARTHARLELANDVPTIIPTISTWDTNFAVINASPNGDLELRTVLEYEGPDGVDAWYRWQEASMVRHTQYRLNEYNGRWYQLTEQCADLTVPGNGAAIPCHVCTLFPTWSDGIIGEVSFALPEWGTRALDEQQYRELSRRLDEYNDAWRSGDLDARLATIEDKTCSVIRIVEVNGDRRHRAIPRTKEELRAAWASPAEGRVLEFELLHQFTTSWYMFAAYTAIIELPDRRVERETARILPIGPNRTFIGELTYSMETAI